MIVNRKPGPLTGDLGFFDGIKFGVRTSYLDTFLNLSSMTVWKHQGFYSNYEGEVLPDEDSSLYQVDPWSFDDYGTSSVGMSSSLDAGSLVLTSTGRPAGPGDSWLFTAPSSSDGNGVVVETYLDIGGYSSTRAATWPANHYPPDWIGIAIGAWQGVHNVMLTVFFCETAGGTRYLYVAGPYDFAGVARTPTYTISYDWIGQNRFTLMLIPGEIIALLVDAPGGPNNGLDTVLLHEDPIPFINPMRAATGFTEASLVAGFITQGMDAVGDSFRCSYFRVYEGGSYTSKALTPQYASDKVVSWPSNIQRYDASLGKYPWEQASIWQHLKASDVYSLSDSWLTLDSTTSEYNLIYKDDPRLLTYSPTATEADKVLGINPSTDYYPPSFSLRVKCRASVSVPDANTRNTGMGFSISTGYMFIKLRMLLLGSERFWGIQTELDSIPLASYDEVARGTLDWLTPNDFRLIYCEPSDVLYVYGKNDEEVLWYLENASQVFNVFPSIPDPAVGAGFLDQSPTVGKFMLSKMEYQTCQYIYDPWLGRIDPALTTPDTFPGNWYDGVTVGNSASITDDYKLKLEHPYGAVGTSAYGLFEEVQANVSMGLKVEFRFKGYGATNEYGISWTTNTMYGFGLYARDAANVYILSFLDIAPFGKAVALVKDDASFETKLYAYDESIRDYVGFVDWTEEYFYELEVIPYDSVALYANGTRILSVAWSDLDLPSPGGGPVLGFGHIYPNSNGSTSEWSFVRISRASAIDYSVDLSETGNRSIQRELSGNEVDIDAYMELFSRSNPRQSTVIFADEKSV